MKQNKHFGKAIEENVVHSLRLADADITTSAELDHNHKIDCLLRIGKKKIGIQLSLKENMSKALAAKGCALEVAPRFIYLTLVSNLFKQPNKNNGIKLHQLLDRITEEFTNDALFVRVGMEFPKISVM